MVESWSGGRGRAGRSLNSLWCLVPGPWSRTASPRLRHPSPSCGWAAAVRRRRCGWRGARDRSRVHHPSPLRARPGNFRGLPRRLSGCSLLNWSGLLRFLRPFVLAPETFGVFRSLRNPPPPLLPAAPKGARLEHSFACSVLRVFRSQSQAGPLRVLRALRALCVPDRARPRHCCRLRPESPSPISLRVFPSSRFPLSIHPATSRASSLRACPGDFRGLPVSPEPASATAGYPRATGFLTRPPACSSIGV